MRRLNFFMSSPLTSRPAETGEKKKDKAGYTLRHGRYLTHGPSHSFHMSTNMTSLGFPAHRNLKRYPITLLDKSLRQGT